MATSDTICSTLACIEDATIAELTAKITGHPDWPGPWDSRSEVTVRTAARRAAMNDAEDRLREAFDFERFHGVVARAQTVFLRGRESGDDHDAAEIFFDRSEEILREVLGDGLDDWEWSEPEQVAEIALDCALRGLAVSLCEVWDSDGCWAWAPPWLDDLMGGADALGNLCQEIADEAMELDHQGLLAAYRAAQFEELADLRKTMARRCPACGVGLRYDLKTGRFVTTAGARHQICASPDGYTFRLENNAGIPGLGTLAEATRLARRLGVDL